MTAEFIRDAAASAAILGLFASSWFGWALETPPLSWRKGLITGSVLSLLAAVAGGVLTWRHWSDGSVFNATTSRNFGIVVGIEVVLAGLGVWLLATRHRSDLIPPWIELVVGVHFFPLASLLDYPLFYPVAVLVTVAALVSVPLAKARSLPISAVTGLLTGLVLLVGAIYSLVTVLIPDLTS